MSFHYFGAPNTLCVRSTIIMKYCNWVENQMPSKPPNYMFQAQLRRDNWFCIDKENNNFQSNESCDESSDFQTIFPIGSCCLGFMLFCLRLVDTLVIEK